MFGFGQQIQTPQTHGLRVSGNPFDRTEVPMMGTPIPFRTIYGYDETKNHGLTIYYSTKHECITTMEQYKTKSLEELRLEDYRLNRKGPRQGMVFGSTQTQQQQHQSTGLFSNLGATPVATPLGPQRPIGGGLFNSFNQPLTNAPSTMFEVFGAAAFGTTHFAYPSTANQSTLGFSGFEINLAAIQSFDFGTIRARLNCNFVSERTENMCGRFQTRPQNQESVFSTPLCSRAPQATFEQIQVPAGTSMPFNVIVKNVNDRRFSSVRYQCVAFMKEYENKSLEELRLEDYQVHRRGISAPEARNTFGGFHSQPQNQKYCFSTIPSNSNDKDNADKVSGDENCNICMEQPKNIVFIPCGHVCCSSCSLSLKMCHICRSRIAQKMKFFL